MFQRASVFTQLLYDDAVLLEHGRRCLHQQNCLVLRGKVSLPQNIL